MCLNFRILVPIRDLFTRTWTTYSHFLFNGSEFFERFHNTNCEQSFPVGNAVDIIFQGIVGSFSRWQVQETRQAFDMTLPLGSKVFCEQCQVESRVLEVKQRGCFNISPHPLTNFWHVVAGLVGGLLKQHSLPWKFRFYKSKNRTKRIGTCGANLLPKLGFFK